MSRDDKRNIRAANRLYRYSAMNEENTDKRNRPLYSKNMNDYLQEKPYPTEEMRAKPKPEEIQAKPEPADDLQSGYGAAFRKEANWQKKLQEAVIWKEILSEPLSKRRRRR
ncbi:MAG: hypothetical protein GX757_07030 [Clostridiales bacterium]|nr:hypothetical protein [Clostridiales bacterium]